MARLPKQARGDVAPFDDGYAACARPADAVAPTDVLQFKQGEREAMPCLDAAVLAMRKGERALLTASARYAFGAPNFPPAAAVDERLVPADSAHAFPRMSQSVRGRRRRSLSSAHGRGPGTTEPGCSECKGKHAA